MGECKVGQKVKEYLSCVLIRIFFGYYPFCRL